jgi:Short C-terminal domain
MIGGTSLEDMVAQAQAQAAQGAGAAGGAPAAPAPADPIEQLEKLAGLHQRGVLTDEEFAAEKAKLLGAS